MRSRLQPQSRSAPPSDGWNNQCIYIWLYLSFRVEGGRGRTISSELPRQEARCDPRPNKYRTGCEEKNWKEGRKKDRKRNWHWSRQNPPSPLTVATAWKREKDWKRENHTHTHEKIEMEQWRSRWNIGNPIENPLIKVQLLAQANINETQHFSNFIINFFWFV